MTDRTEPTEREGFLRRWSRLKHAEKPPDDAPPDEGSAEDAPAPCPALPPLDSLDATSDYTVFLARGVAAEVRRQALRKAWTSDPVIANFRGLADYDWDFNAPGYGQLLPTDDIARLCDAVFRDAQSAAPAKSEPEPEPEPEPEAVADTPVPVIEAAAEPAPAPAPSPPRRHGGATPI